MNQRIRNPHTFDMGPYFSGEMCVIGGIDFDKEEKAEAPQARLLDSDRKEIKLDWSFLHTLPLKTSK